jgi:phosphoribosylformylglycinamidine synthase
MQQLRDHPECAQQEYDRILDAERPGLSVTLSFDPADDVAAPFINTGARPRVAILREQGVNGHVEMAAAFDRAGFAAIDVHMSDILAGRVTLADFKGVVACGGFSYGDVLGAGQGWAKTILFNERARDDFSRLLRPPRHLRPRRLQRLPDDERAQGHHPRRRRLAAFRTQPRRAVRSALFDGRDARVAVALLRRHGGSRLPVVVSHGEGRAVFASAEQQAQALVAMRYVDTAGQPTEVYPYNPNGSPAESPA